MAFLEKKKRRFGDRWDAVRVKDAPAMNIIMAHLFPNRADAECCMQQELDVTEVLKYIAKKNEADPDHKTTFFHCFITMVCRLANQRRLLNRFSQGGRLYERDTISVAFVAKRQKADHAEEQLVTYIAKGEDTLTEVSRFVRGEVDTVRKEKKAGGGVGKTIDTFAKLPRPILAFVAGFLRWVDKWWGAPKSIATGDSNFATFLLSNLGSIKCPSVYHHLNNYGSNSIMITIGTIQKKKVLQDDGTYLERDVVDISATVDERIADGFYFAKSFRCFNYMCAHPEILDLPLEEEVPLSE